jgi:hypothetical protein
MEDDLDAYLVRAGSETFERPLDGGPEDWVLGDSPTRATYVKLSQVIQFPTMANSGLVYKDLERQKLVGVSNGYGIMGLLTDKQMETIMQRKRRRKTR